MLNGSYQPLCEQSGGPLEVRIGPLGTEPCILAVDTLRENAVVVLTQTQVEDLKASGRWVF